MSIFRLKSHSRGLGISPRRSRPAGGAPTGDTEAPSTPQNLIATAVSSSQIDLTWDASTDNVAVTGYDIYRDNVLVDTSPTNSYSDTGLDPGTEYEYEVSAFDAASNESARSAPDSATTHQVIVTAGLVAEWRFDDGAGQQVTDYSGNGFHALLGPTAGIDNNEPTWSPTGVDCVLDASLNYVSTGSTLGISGGAARTVICVAQVNRVDADTECGGFGSWVGATSGGRWWFFPSFNTNNFDLRVGSTTHTYSTLGTIPNGAWRFFALAQAGNNLNTCTGYLDEASETASTSATINTTGNFEIQSRGNSSGVNTWGKVAYQLVYNRALSAAEVEQNRQALKAILAGRGITLP